MSTKPKVCGQLDGIEPELGGRVVAIHVNMGRLVRLMAIEIESIRAGSEHRRHARDCNRCQHHVTTAACGSMVQSGAAGDVVAFELAVEGGAADATEPSCGKCRRNGTSFHHLFIWRFPSASDNPCDSIGPRKIPP